MNRLKIVKQCDHKIERHFLVLFYSTKPFKMNKITSKKPKQLCCLLCNGRHSHEVHDSCPLISYARDKKGKKMIGKYHPKVKEVMYIMTNSKTFNIESLNVQSLRLMATCFVYDNSSNLIVCGEKKTYSPNLDKEFQYNPIPLTLPKKQLQKELTKKWEKLHALRRKKKDGPPEVPPDYTCPICMEQMGRYEWFHYEYRFVTKIRSHHCIDYNECGSNPVKTSCGHMICSNCTSKLVGYNGGVEFRTFSDYGSYGFHHQTIVRDQLLRMYNLSCPLCRANTILEKRIGIDKDSVWKKDKSKCFFERPYKIKVFHENGTIVWSDTS